MRKILFTGCPGLSPVISNCSAPLKYASQIEIEKKLLKTHLYISRSFSVISVGTPGELCQQCLLAYSKQVSLHQKFLIQRSRFRVRLTDWFGILNWLNLCIQCSIGPYGRFIRTMVRRSNHDPNCRKWRWLSKYKLQCTARSTLTQNILFITKLKFLFLLFNMQKGRPIILINFCNLEIPGLERRQSRDSR